MISDWSTICKEPELTVKGGFRTKMITSESEESCFNLSSVRVRRGFGSSVWGGGCACYLRMSAPVSAPVKAPAKRSPLMQDGRERSGSLGTSPYEAMIGKVSQHQCASTFVSCSPHVCARKPHLHAPTPLVFLLSTHKLLADAEASA
jgi:hypothetical protein